MCDREREREEEKEASLPCDQESGGGRQKSDLSRGVPITISPKEESVNPQLIIEIFHHRFMNIPSFR